MKKYVFLGLIAAMVFAFSGCGNSSNEFLLEEIERLRSELEVLQSADAQFYYYDLEHGTKNSYILSDDSNMNRQDRYHENESLRDAWEMITAEVIAMLRFPDTAEFEDFSNATIFQVYEDVIEIFGNVSAQNALGNATTNSFVSTVFLDFSGTVTEIRDTEFLSGTELTQRLNTANQREQRYRQGHVYLTVEEFDEAVRTQPLFVDSTRFLPPEHFRLSTDSMLQAILFNNSDMPIRNARVAFVAWDANRLPVRIDTRFGIGTAQYVVNLNYDAINLMPFDFFTGVSGNSYSGLRVNNTNIVHLRAFVVSFEDFDNNKWENPLLLDFNHLFEGRILS